MIKRAFVPFALILSFLTVSFSSCDQIVSVLEDLLSEGDATEGLKEALRVGTDTSINKGSALNGYFANQAIKILLPPEAQTIVTVINQVPGVGPALVDEVILKLNRAAEDAAPEAKDILVNAILNITITDAINIVNGNNDAATQFLRLNTQTEIAGLFLPHIESSLETVGAQTAWGTLTSNYNTVAPILGQPQVNTDLADYTTNKALDGLFVLVAEEEGKIREDPLHRVSEILQQVFGTN
ncbi:MAG TPA: DUF4197 domain-containing protein [Flavobacteriales bacterium]|nr:DUF4197 domain-containing protein [Flavobacteriales bacterium]HAP68355.1 DUF4197 domain-containing protein [Flavobacteriales bacterium]